MLALTAQEVIDVATLTIRGLAEETRLALKQLAASHDRSMEAEARAILESAVKPRSSLIEDWLSLTEDLRGEFELPERSMPREVDFS